ncbi:MAG: YicC family protein [Clostridiales bacterium]|jgi:uncharacterized protein (TIGR00255 family)|nr:YicC family protein [Clostridiales bacterium]
MIVYSMTGYGKYAAENALGRLTAEIKSVNNRFLEVNMRLPRAFSGLEERVRTAVAARLQRGSVDVFLRFDEGAALAKSVNVDVPLAKAYTEAARTLGAGTGVGGALDLVSLLRLPDVLVPAATEVDAQKAKELLDAAIAGALEGLTAMRAREGEALLADLTATLAAVESGTAAAETRAPAVVAEYREKLSARMREILAGVAVDEARLLNEVAFFADKADVHEEITRLLSHIEQFRLALTTPACGRKLDFLSQEMTREINTLGSKSNDTALTKIVVALKNDNEKLKEQLRNVE